MNTTDSFNVCGIAKRNAAAFIIASHNIAVDGMKSSGFDITAFRRGAGGSHSVTSTLKFVWPNC